MKKNNIPKARKDGLVVQELDGETLIYNLKTNRAVCLNQTSALIWQNCDGTKTVVEISTFLAKELKNPVNEDLIWLALDQLKKENLIENPNELETKFAGVSRREVIKKVGLGTMIALPIVTGLIAPKAAMAASFCGQTCQNNGECSTIANCSTCGQRPGGAPNDKICQA